MARADDYNSASTQFFIVGNTFTGAADSNYAAFGWLYYEFRELQTARSSMPIKDDVPQHKVRPKQELSVLFAHKLTHILLDEFHD